MRILEIIGLCRKLEQKHVPGFCECLCVRSKTGSVHRLRFQRDTLVYALRHAKSPHEITTLKQQVGLVDEQLHKEFLKYQHGQK